MKQSFARQHSHNRNRTPPVIHLPPARPPVAAKRAEAVLPEAAMSLPDTPEPLVTKQAEAVSPPAPALSRQARRQALRAEAKALRRQGHPPAPAAQPAPPPIIEPPIATAEAEAALESSVLAATVAALDADTPLPAARALVAARPRGLALFAHRLRAIFGQKRTSMVPAAEGAIAGQLRALRKELAALQQSVDRMIDGVAA